MKRWTFPIALSLFLHALILSWAALCFYLPEEPKQRQIAVRLVRMPALTAHAEAGKIEEYPGPAPAFEESKTGQVFKAEENEKEISNNNAKKDTTAKAKNTPKTLGKNQKEIKNLKIQETKNFGTQRYKACSPIKKRASHRLRTVKELLVGESHCATRDANDTPSSVPSRRTITAHTTRERGSTHKRCRKTGKTYIPLASRRRGEEGTVLLEVRVDPSGTVEEVRIVEGVDTHS